MICIKFILLHRKKASPSVIRSALKDISKVSSVETSRECYEPKIKRKCTEPERKKMSNDLMKLIDMELNCMYFDFKTNSDDTSNIN